MTRSCQLSARGSADVHRLSDNHDVATGFELRDYRASDFEEIVALDRECFEPGIAYPAGEMRRLVSLVTREAVVAVSEETLAGFCLGYRSPARVGRIITLDVRSTHRRGGVGRALLEETIRRLAAAGSRETVLEVDLRNTPALTFYERLGFRRRRTIPGYYGPGIPGVEMFRETPGAES